MLLCPVMQKTRASREEKSGRKIDGVVTGSSGPGSAENPRLWTVAAVSLILAGATIAAYWGVRENGFVAFDDNNFITANHYVKNGLSWDGLKWAFTELYTDYWHPLTWLSLMLDVQLFGLRAGGHHLVNLGIHVANTLLLFAFLRYTTGRLWASAFVAALFALHPLHVESVAWAAERKDVLSTLFWFATLWAYAHYTRKPCALRYTGVIVLFALGLMCKPMLVTLPLVLLLVDYWPLERFNVCKWRLIATEGLTIRRLILEKAPLVVMAMATSTLTVIGQQKVAMVGLESAGSLSRVTNAIAAYGSYISKMFWPQNLAMFYPYPYQLPYVEAGIWLILLAAITVWAFRLSIRYRYIIMGWLWYLVTLLPVIGLIRAGDQARADRYTYISLTGLFIIVAWGTSELIRRKTWLKVPAGIAAIAILTACGCLTWRTTGYWRDSITIFERTVSVTKDNFRILTLLAGELVKKGETTKALALLNDTHAKWPRQPMILCGIAGVLADCGRNEESLKLFEEALEVRPDLREAHLGAGLTLISLGRFAEAEDHLRTASQLGYGAGVPLAFQGLALLNMGRSDESLEVSVRAMKFDPDIWMAHFVAAKVYLGKRDITKALAELDICNRLGATGPTLFDYGTCMMQLGRMAEAEKAFRQAIQMQPNYAPAVVHYNLASVLAKTGRKDEALAELNKSIAADPKYEDARKYYRELTGGKE
jgi:tetratricopeptide (TPR) repeat protein